MKRHSASLISALCVLALVGGCQGASTANGLRPSGALVMSPDDSLVYVADTDNNQVVIANVAKQQVVKTVKVGNWPERIQVGPSGRLFVSDRQSRAISVVDPAAGKEIARISVGTEPLGLALSPDGRTLAVANSTNGTVSLIDTGSLTVTSTLSMATNSNADSPIPNPVGVAFATNTKLYVTQDHTGLVNAFDLGSGHVTTTLSLGLTASQTNGENRLPGQPVDPLIFNGHLYVGQVLSKSDPTPTQLTTGPIASGSSYAGGGGVPGSVAVVANGVATIDTTTDSVLHGQGLEAFSGASCAGCLSGRSTSFDAVPPVIMTTLNEQPMSGASAMAIEPNGKFMYITNLNSSNVAVLATDGSVNLTDGSSAPVPGSLNISSTGSNGVLALVHVGGGPKGIAIPASGDRAYVYNSFDESISVLGASSGQITEISNFRISESPLTLQEQLGRRLFHAADDSRMTDSSAGGISCASCHPGGRTDGRTWQFTEGNRNTPLLAGRDLANTAPYHWDGTLKDFNDFQKIVQERMGGTGESTPSGTLSALTQSDFDAIFAYVETLPMPDNPNLNPDGTPVNADAVARGKALFVGKAQCVACHSGADHTDNLFHDVGTEGHLAANGMPELFPNHVNTPPLNALFDSAPYLHDGSLATLDDRLDPTKNPGDLHGITSSLTVQERSDLVEYLKTL